MFAIDIPELIRLIDMAFFAADIQEGCPNAQKRMRDTMSRFVNSPLLVDKAMYALDQMVDQRGLAMFSLGDYAALVHCLQCMTIHLN